MGRIRCIKPELPLSESLSRVSRDARLLFAYLFTLADDEGRLRGNPLMLTRALYPYDPEPDLPRLVDGWLAELDQRAKCIVRYAAGGDQYIAILDFVESKSSKPPRPDWAQRIDHPSASKLPAPPLAIVHESSDALAHHAEPVIPGPREASREVVSHNDTSRSLANAREGTPDDDRQNQPREDSRTLAVDLNLNQDHGPDSRSLAKGRERPTATEVFNRFWEKRLKRKGPDPEEAARREFLAAVRKGEDPELIEAGMLRYAAANAEKAGTEFVARTDKALRERIWKGYPAPEPVTQPAIAASEPVKPAAVEDERWTRVRAALVGEVGRQVFDSWFAKLEFAALGHGTVLLVAETRFIKSSVGANHNERLTRLWRAEDSSVRRVQLLARGIDPVQLPEPEVAAVTIEATAQPAAAAREPEPAPAPTERHPPAASSDAKTPGEVAEETIETEGIAQIVGYGRSRGQALALVGRWLVLLGRDYKLLATLFGEVKTLGLKDQHAIRWLEQQVAAHKARGQNVLPHTMPPMAVDKHGKAGRPAPIVVKRANRRR